MKTANDLWEEIGSLGEDEQFHVVTKLFASYEEKLKSVHTAAEAQCFFQCLENCITQTVQCNSNRR